MFEQDIEELEKYIDKEIDQDNKVIPFHEVMRLVNTLSSEGIPNNKRIAILWLALTGGRPCEVEDRNIKEFLMDKYWVWRPRKMQRGKPRIEPLPRWFICELKEYLLKGKYSSSNIFGLSGESLARYINGQVRKKLGGNWLMRKPEFHADGTVKLVYLWQLKHLRHNFQTVEWYRSVEKYGHDLALMKLSRRMRHSSKHMTGQHYIENVEALNLERYKGLDIGSILKKINQKELFDFM